jgi:hypothetical protein
VNRAEALATLHEILDALQESVLMYFISLDDSNISKTSVDYEIVLRCELDRQAKEIIKPILVRRHLAMKESKGLVNLQTKGLAFSRSKPFRKTPKSHIQLGNYEMLARFLRRLISSSSIPRRVSAFTGFRRKTSAQFLALSSVLSDMGVPVKRIFNMFGATFLI